MCLTSDQGCTNPGRLVDVATKFWTMVTRFLENVCTPVLKVVSRSEFSLNLLYSLKVQTGYGAHKDTFNGYRLSFLRVKGPGRDDHTPPSAEVKNESSYVSTSPICLDDVNMGNCTFTLVSLPQHTKLRSDSINHVKAAVQRTIYANTGNRILTVQRVASHFTD